MSKRLVLVASLIAAIILIAMMNFTTPLGVGPFGVLVFFTTFYVLMYGVALVLLKILQKILRKDFGRKEGVYVAAIAFGPIMLMLAQALGTMSWATVGLTVTFVLLACFLISKK